jgi:cation diffusion facilitator family transporter
MEIKDTEKIALEVSRNTIISNIILTIFKLFAGIYAKSSAMISDAVHSASDVLTTVIVIIGIKFSNKESDAEHQYGHERMECVAAIILAVLLCATGAGLGYAGVIKIINANYNKFIVPGKLAIIAAVVSIVIKELMYWYTKIYAKKIDSVALTADAWHHRSDAFSSIGSLIGICGARIGFPVMDPLAGLIISIFIIKVSFNVFRDATGKMTDRACNKEYVESIIEVIKKQPGVIRVDQVKTRLFSDKVYVDVEISANGNETLNNTHAIAQKVHDVIEKEFPKVKHCMVHVNPFTELYENP